MARSERHQDPERSAEARRLLEEARALPGVAEVLRIYGQAEQTLEAANTYQIRSVATSSTGNNTV